MEADVNAMRGLERATVGYILRERSYIYHNLVLAMVLLLFTLVDMVIIIVGGLGREGHIVLPPLLYMLVLALALLYYSNVFRKWDARLDRIMSGGEDAPVASITNIYYELIDFAENRKWQFYLLYIGFVPFLLGGLYSLFVEGAFQARFILVDIIMGAQLVALVGALVYLAVQINHDLAWRKKMRKLEALERIVGEEIGPVEDD